MRLRILSFSLFLFLCACNRGFSEAPEVCFDNHCFHVELADTDQARIVGLQNRTSLKEGTGMLFIFPFEGKHSFWMKETLIPLDMIWLDYSHRVVHIASQVPPCKSDPCPTYASPQNALYVLEINSGQANRLGIQEGDTAEFHLK